MPQVDQFGKPVTQGTAYRFGQLVSQIFHPTLNGIASFFVIGAFANTGVDLLRGLWWAGICILVLITPTTFYFYNRLRGGSYSDEDVSRRSDRHMLYVVSLVSIVVGSVVLWFLGVPRPFLKLIGAGVLTIGTCALVNLKWKISVHAASVGTLATLISLLVRGGITFWLVAALVGWARLRTGNHTIWQVLAGWGVAIIGIVLVFRIGV